MIAYHRGISYYPVSLEAATSARTNSRVRGVFGKTRSLEGLERLISPSGCRIERALIP